jgi:membrane protein implicated in regulation of membrane protease activity
MHGIHELDGFQLFSGLLAMIAGPVMLLMGAPAWWALLIVASGTVVLVAQCAILAGTSREHRHHGSV